MQQKNEEIRQNKIVERIKATGEDIQTLFEKQSNYSRTHLIQAGSENKNLQKSLEKIISLTVFLIILFLFACSFFVALKKI